ncbi:hypothetical protein C8R47DRAFT_428318 [Mycena vitilis]|nr:hypothetical protein C8R47DRAFT_428318 [Mycena vitilis]
MDVVTAFFLLKFQLIASAFLVPHSYQYMTRRARQLHIASHPELFLHLPPEGPRREIRAPGGGLRIQRALILGDRDEDGVQPGRSSEEQKMGFPMISSRYHRLLEFQRSQSIVSILLVAVTPNAEPPPHATRTRASFTDRQHHPHLLRIDICDSPRRGIRVSEVYKSSAH